MKRLTVVLAVWLTMIFATAAFAEVRTVSLSVSGMT